MYTEDFVYVITDTDFIVTAKRALPYVGEDKRLNMKKMKYIEIRWAGEDLVDNGIRFHVELGRANEYLDQKFFEILKESARNGGLNLDILHVINEKLTLEDKIITLIKNVIEKTKEETRFSTIDLQIKRKVSLGDFKRVLSFYYKWDANLDGEIDYIIEKTPHPFKLPEMEEEYKKWVKSLRQELEDKSWTRRVQLSWLLQQLALLYLIQNTQ